VIFPATGTLGALAIGVGGTATLSPGGGKMLTLDTISSTGQFDLGDNDLIVKSTARDLVEAMVQSGRRGGDWLGTGIISLSAAATVEEASTSLAVAQGSDITSGIFNGVTVNGTDALVKYTWSGDANLDGVVNFDDFNKFLGGNNDPIANPPRWFTGDFNFDGGVNFDDFNKFLAGYNAFNGGGQIPF
jgi:hypothetical protein